MKNTLRITCALFAFAATPAFAAAAAGEHEHAAHGAALQLDAGRKWQTDAPLRENMRRIRQAMTASLPAIHASQLSGAGYAALAGQIEGSVGDIVAQCKLPPAADAQLHIIIGELLVGAGQMAGQSPADQRRDGAIKVLGAIDDYGRYFDDPGFTP